ncbi:MAG: 3-hydroxyacyl-ACP dehydratase FabZ [Clostridia bacterium]|nr:3-hydroxyacyl-ACP dehydratase FabZ [Clostridia bacterium]
MNREEIKEILPHREPMLLVDEAYANEDGTSTGIYNVRGDEFFLQGHFPENPIVPGVILCEMAAQSSCLLMADKVKGKATLYAGMNNVKFKNPVRPGDRVEFTCSHIRSLGPFHFIKAEGKVNGKLAVSGEFSFALVDPEKTKQ